MNSNVIMKMIQSMKQNLTVLNIKIRESMNPYLAPYRRNRAGLNKGESITIISNNCWGGHVYRYFGLPYTSPTVGLFFFTEDYLKFLGNLEHYLNEEIQFISHDQSKYKDILKERNTPPCPIGVLDDIEIVFLHYHSEEEARTKWNRRKERMNLSKVIVKMTEQNLCDPSQLMQFDSLSYKNKFVFVHKDYGLNSQIVCKEFENCSEVTNDTDHFRRYIDLVALIRNLS